MEDFQITADSNVEYYHPHTTYVQDVFGKNEYKAWGIGNSNDNYVIKGWKIEYSDGTSLESIYETSVKSFILYDDTTKVTGIWGAPVEIIFHSKSSPDEEGEDIIKKQYIKYSIYTDNFKLESNTFTKEGYKFKQWKMENTNRTFNDKHSLWYSNYEGQTINLYAIWEEN